MTEILAPRPWNRGDRLVRRRDGQVVTFDGFHTAQASPGRYYRRALVTLPDGRQASMRLRDLREPTGETLTLHDLAGDGDWPLRYGGFRLERGTVVWESADYPERGEQRRVRVQRLEPNQEGGPTAEGGRWILRAVTAYLAPETRVVMVEPDVRQLGPAQSDHA